MTSTRHSRTVDQKVCSINLLRQRIRVPHLLVFEIIADLLVGHTSWPVQPVIFVQHLAMHTKVVHVQMLAVTQKLLFIITAQPMWRMGVVMSNTR